MEALFTTEYLIYLVFTVVGFLMINCLCHQIELVSFINVTNIYGVIPCHARLSPLHALLPVAS
jgi:hypothetical protein